MQNKKEINPRNNKGIPHGYWETYFSNNKLFFKCYYINDVEYGYEEVDRYRIKKIRYYAR
jgi:hypothetical protein